MTSNETDMPYLHEVFIEIFVFSQHQFLRDSGSDEMRTTDDNGRWPIRLMCLERDKVAEELQLKKPLKFGLVSGF
jgi:hypothetical protein